MFNKIALSLLSLGLMAQPVLAQEDPVVIKVASHLEPMTDIVELAGENVREGYEIELVEVSDNIQYNEAVFNDEAFASLAQHEPFMEMFNQERDADLVAIQPIYNAVVGFYSPVYENFEEIEDGAEVAIPTDPTNEARALLILESYDLITLDEEAGTFPTVDDVVDNPKNLVFTNIDLLNLTSAYEDGVELVFNYPTYIAKLDLTPADALFLENDTENKFAQTLVIREGNLDSVEAEVLVEAFTSQAVRDFVDGLVEQGGYINAIDTADAEEAEESTEVEESVEETFAA